MRRSGLLFAVAALKFLSGERSIFIGIETTKYFRIPFPFFAGNLLVVIGVQMSDALSAGSASRFASPRHDFFAGDGAVIVPIHASKPSWSPFPFLTRDCPVVICVHLSKFAATRPLSATSGNLRILREDRDR